MLRVESRDGVRIVWIEHGRANALDIELSHALTETLGEAAEDPSCAALVLSGTGGIFSAGVDLFRILDSPGSYLVDFLEELTAMIDQLARFPRPLVAAVNGHAIAGGGIMVFASDYRVMVDRDARLGTPELRVGVPFPNSALQVLRTGVPRQALRDLIWQGRLYQPEEAVEAGLVDELQPYDRVVERAVAVAADLASIPNASFALTKRQLRTLDLTGPDPAHQEEVEGLWASSEIQDTVRAYLEATLGKSSRAEADRTENPSA